MLKSNRKKNIHRNDEKKIWKKPKLTEETPLSSVKDVEEKQLESYLFGDDSGNFLFESKSDESAAVIEGSDNEEDTLLSFSISTKPDLNDDNCNEVREDVFTLQPSNPKTKAVWNDPDDVNVSVDVENNKRLRKLRKAHNEKVLSGTIFQERLKNQFEKIIPTPAWADLNKKSVEDDQESDDEEDRIFRSSQRVTTKGNNLPKNLLKINRVRDLNYSHPSNGTITSVEFHPTAKIAFTASLNQKLTLFQVDGKHNQKLQSIHLTKFPIFSARFLPHGDKVILSSQRKFYYSYDLVSGQVIKIPEIQGHSEKSLDRFVISPDGETIAFLGSSGYIHLVSTKNYQWMSSLKINGHVFTVSFSPDSLKLFAAGSDGEVYVWDLRSCRCQHRFVDDGSISTHTLSVSGNGRYLACGSSSGVVNVYDGCYHENKTPAPSKVLLNLTTRIAGTKFNPTSEILAYYSPQVRNALKLVHFPSLTVFSNWPVNKQTLGNVSSVDFSPLSGYLAVGNENGKALLFREIKKPQPLHGPCCEQKEKNDWLTIPTPDKLFMCRGLMSEEEANSESEDGAESKEIYEGSLNICGERHGRGTLYFDISKTEKFQGHFKNGLKHGKGSFYFSDGSSLSGMFIDDDLVGKGLYLYEDGSLMVGTYRNGELNGPAEDYDTEGRLTFKGEYTDNVRSGVCHHYFQFGGRLFGVVDKNGKFSGKGFVYAYPDEQTFLKGRFEGGDMLAASEAVYDGVGEKDNPHSYKKLKDGFQYYKDVSTNKVISADPKQSDCYEKKRVTVKKSLIEDANEGLFSLIHAAPNEVMSFYSGIRITHSEVDSRDWKFNDNTISLDDEIVIDVPHIWYNPSTYCASLGHKANHSFEPNCKYDRYNHPRFGSIKCIRTIQNVRPGDELTVAYGYDHSKLETDCPGWYRRKLKMYLDQS